MQLSNNNMWVPVSQLDRILPDSSSQSNDNNKETITQRLSTLPRDAGLTSNTGSKCSALRRDSSSALLRRVAYELSEDGWAVEARERAGVSDKEKSACGESPLIKAGGRYAGMGCKLEKWVGLCAFEHLPNNRIHRVRKEQCWTLLELRDIMSMALSAQRRGFERVAVAEEPSDLLLPQLRLKMVRASPTWW